MHVCKNKSSGKYFIYIHDAGNGEALLVTPGTDIKALNVGLFEDVEEKEEDYLLSSCLITEAQIQRFREYLKDRSDDVMEQFEYFFEQKSPYEQKSFIEMLKTMAEKGKK